jgi:capsular polysaccharide biosynthesis protein
MGAVGRNYIAATAQMRAYALAEGAAPTGRVYLSRRMFEGGSHRAVANEVKLEELFARHGFSVVMPEQLPIGDQIRALANADFVAGLDGSAMHLCGFMRAGAKVLIIESRPFPAQGAINRALGLETLTAPTRFVGKEDGVDLYAADLAAVSRLISSAS